MREILFKGRRVDTGEWIDGDLCRTPEEGCCIVVAGSYEEPEHGYKECLTERVRVDPEMVCQFTGLYDSTKWQDLTESEREQWTRSGSMPSEWNGKRIFEGDVAKLKHCTAHYTCTWAPEAACFYWRCNVTNDHSNIHHEAEIIGNIHDKKEGV